MTSIKKVLFKKGDVIVPLNGRKSSNGWPFSRITKFEVMEDYTGYNMLRLRITLRALEYGSIYRRESYDSKGDGDIISVFPDAFEPFKAKPILYSVF